jgi:poly(3-hydroxybutyrate) depolymerase
LAKQQVKDNDNDNAVCDVGSDAMTNYLSRIMNNSTITAPQYCVPNPLTHGGGLDTTTRCYYLFVPDCASGLTPLVMDMHAADSCPLLAASYDRWAETSMKNCFAIFWPIGITNSAISDNTCFHIPGGRDVVSTLYVTEPCCCHQGGNMLDNNATLDLLVVKTMIQDIFTEKRMEQQSNGVATMDAKRIYMAGHANGCMGALGMGVTYSDVVAAVCCHSGALLTPIPETYHPIPTWIVYGKLDHVVWPQLVEETATHYQYVHNCSCETDSVTTTTTQLDGGVMHSYCCCHDDDDETCIHNATTTTMMTLVALDHSGHFPFYRASESSPGAKMTEMDTTQMAWEFCSSHVKDHVPQGYSGQNIGISEVVPMILACLTTLLLAS